MVINKNSDPRKTLADAEKKFGNNFTYSKSDLKRKIEDTIVLSKRTNKDYILILEFSTKEL